MALRAKRQHVPPETFRYQRVQLPLPNQRFRYLSFEVDKSDVLITDAARIVLKKGLVEVVAAL